MKELLFGVPVVIFLLWILSAPLPAERIERGCEPITWVGNLVTSTTALAVDAQTVTAARWSVKLNYSCKYLVWRLFYQDAYNKAIGEGRVIPSTTSPAIAPDSPSSSPASAGKGAEKVSPSSSSEETAK